MISLYKYISTTNPEHVLNEKEREILLKLDKEYGKFFKEFWFKWDRTDCTNLKEEWRNLKRREKIKKNIIPKLS